MGACFSRDSGQSAVPVVVLLGLDGSGATTILYQLLLQRRLQTIPTLGQNHERVTVNGIELNCWDIGGLETLRKLWAQYSAEADGIVFVIDATDRSRFLPAAKELKELFTPSAASKDESPHRYATPSVPLLVLANKQDLADAATVEELSAAIDFDSLPSMNKKLVPCTAADYASLCVSLKWITDYFTQNKTLQRSGRILSGQK
jgi:small GTP-binding protein